MKDSREPSTVERDRALVAMREPSFYPGHPQAVEVRETHVSIVFIAGNRAYKVKKAVRLPFLDYGTLARRRFFCEEEARLNRRFAPGTYLGVRAIVPRGDGFALCDQDAKEAVEYAVEMRRLPEERSLARLVTSGEADSQMILRVARRVADLHAESPAAPPGFGGPSDVSARLDENFQTLRSFVGEVVDSHVFAAVRRFAGAFVDANRELMQGRVEAGRVREVHGDLRAEHIIVGEELLIYDCIDFDRRLRCVDVAGDVAFTIMDLERLGARDLARALEHAYAGASGDPRALDLVPFYASYRALVRAKVACVRYRQLEQGAPARAHLRREAQALSQLALSFAWRSRLPLALVFCGPAASGKSTLARDVSRRSGLRRLSSDAVRKELAGLPPHTRAEAALYGQDFTERTYRELARRAAEAAASEGGVLIDATFLTRAHRELVAASLRRAGARVLFAECRAPLPTLVERGRVRERAPQHGSDATAEVVQAQALAFEPPTEVGPEDHLVVDTNRPVEESLDQLEELVSEAVDTVPIDRR